MFNNIDTWRVVCYLVSYPVAVLPAYFSLLYRKDKRSWIMGILYHLIAISIVFVIALSPHVSVIQVIILLPIWGTCGLLGIIFYHIHKKLLKRKDNG